MKVIKKGDVEEWKAKSVVLSPKQVLKSELTDIRRRIRTLESEIVRKFERIAQLLK